MQLQRTRNLIRLVLIGLAALASAFVALFR